MKVYRPMPIDRTLRALEDIADSKGLRLEDVPGYVELCGFLTDLEDNEPTEYISGVEAFETLSLCCPWLGWKRDEVPLEMPT